MVNDWIDLTGLVLPNGEVVQPGFLTVTSHDGVEAVLALENSVLTIRDKGSVSRDDDMSVMNNAPEIYNIQTGRFCGEITVEEIPTYRLIFVNNVLNSII